MTTLDNNEYERLGIRDQCIPSEDLVQMMRRMAQAQSKPVTITEAKESRWPKVLAKWFLVLVGIVFLIGVLVSVAKADDEIIKFLDNSTVGALSIMTDPVLTISIEDGQLALDGKSIDRMSDPEIKAVMKKLAKWLENREWDRSLVDYYYRQTGYLLQELEKCQKNIKK